MMKRHWIIIFTDQRMSKICTKCHSQFFQEDGDVLIANTEMMMGLHIGGEGISTRKVQRERQEGEGLDAVQEVLRLGEGEQRGRGRLRLQVEVEAIQQVQPDAARGHVAGEDSDDALGELVGGALRGHDAREHVQEAHHPGHGERLQLRHLEEEIDLSAHLAQLEQRRALAHGEEAVQQRVGHARRVLQLAGAVVPVQRQRPVLLLLGVRRQVGLQAAADLGVQLELEADGQQLLDVLDRVRGGKLGQQQLQVRLRQVVGQRAVVLHGDVPQRRLQSVML